MADYTFLLRHAQVLAISLVRNGFSFSEASELLSLPTIHYSRVTLNDRISFEQLRYATNRYCQLMNDPLSHIKLGLSISSSEVGEWGTLFTSCTNLRESFDTYIHHFSSFGNFGNPFWHKIDESNIALYSQIYEVDIDDASLILEMRYAAILSLAKLMTRGLFPDLISRVCFQHTSTAPNEDYQTLFGCPVEFSADYTGVVLKESQLDIGFNFPNDKLKNTLTEAIDSPTSLDCRKTLVNEVRNLIRENLSNKISRAEVSIMIGMSESTLKRKLSDYNTSFRQLIEQERYSQGLKLLNKGEHSVAEISAQLGYSNMSAFSVMFKRINGLSPTEYQLRVF